MLWVIAAVSFGLGFIAYVTSKWLAYRKFMRGDMNEAFGDFFTSAGQAMSGFASSRTPDEAIKAGANGMSEVLQGAQKSQKKMANKVKFEMALNIAGRALMVAGAIVAVIALVI